ncbi:FAD-binding protein [Nocardioides mangrovicus]|uniref:FAD-binding protein n=1 Tax=Nocardioides mangrovicus TaxID=2478913 RepID=UPI001314F0E2|nr:FAD-binding protein [Nocardioides mangrovicus]
MSVIVVGFGPAGAAAAVAAHDAGADVVVLEASPAGGGNAPYSGGFLFDLPEDRMVDHLRSLSFDRTPLDVLEAYGRGVHELPTRLPELGIDLTEFTPPPGRFPATFPSWPGFPGGRDVRYTVAAGGEGRRGVRLWQGLEAAVRSREIEVRCSARVDRLMMSEAAVTGVVLADGSSLSGSVVLTCGGFEGDAALADAYLPLGPTYPVGHGYNDGAGLRMAQQAGAALWHMYGFFGWFSVRVPEFAAPFAVDFLAAGHVLLDAEGRRFADETGFEVHDRLRALTTYLPRNANRPALPTWAVFDEPTRLAGPLNGLLGTPNDYTWSADNGAEVERGWIRTGAGVVELAAATGLDAGVLGSSLERYNEHAAAGVDPDFHREPETLVPLELDRLYAVPTWPGVAGTTGGPRHDARAQVLRTDGAVVPGLYAAGAVSLVWGHLIDHGGGLTDALVFGRIAGEQAARG